MVGNSKQLSHKTQILLEHLNLKKEQLLCGIEDGLSDFDSCLAALKVFYAYIVKNVLYIVNINCKGCIRIYTKYIF